MKRKPSKPSLFTFRADEALLQRVADVQDHLGGEFTSSAVVRRALVLGLERLEKQPALMVVRQVANG